MKIIIETANSKLNKEIKLKEIDQENIGLDTIRVIENKEEGYLLVELIINGLFKYEEKFDLDKIYEFKEQMKYIDLNFFNLSVTDVKPEYRLVISTPLFEKEGSLFMITRHVIQDDYNTHYTLNLDLKEMPFNDFLKKEAK